MVTKNKNSYKKSLKSSIKATLIYALASSSVTKAFSKSDEDSLAHPQYTRVPKECTNQLLETKQAIGIFAKVAERLGALHGPADMATDAALAKQSQNIHSCHEEVKNRHIKNGDVTFISSDTLENYHFEDKIEKFPVSLSSDVQGYAVFDPKKIS